MRKASNIINKRIKQEIDKNQKGYVAPEEPSAPTRGQEEYAITITVVDKNNNGIEGSTVTIGDEEIYTMDDGNADFYLKKGKYEATIEADGYITDIIDINVTDHEMFVITLESVSSNNNKPIEDLGEDIEDLDDEVDDDI